MHAIVLAGGKGRRLRPYTVSFPKPLVPVGDMPIIEVIVRQLAAGGFTRVTVSTGHLAELIETYLGDGSRFDVMIDYSRETAPLSTAGAVALVPDPAEHVLVMNGDVLCDLDLAGLLERHAAGGADATVATFHRSNLVDFGVVVPDANGDLAEWVEKPVHEYDVSMGVYALSRAAIGLIEPGESIGMPDLLLRVKERGGRVACVPHDGYWLDIGRPDDYERAQTDFEAAPGRFLP